MELKSDAYDAQSPRMLHMDVHYHVLGFLHMMHSPKIQVWTTMLSSTHHCGLTILVDARGMCGAENFLIMERMHQT